MPSRKTTRTARRLLKVASLGLAGLLAGLLSGCSASPDNFTLASTSSWHLTSHDRYTFRHGSSRENHPIPDFKHAPAPHHTESWAFQTPPQQVSNQLDPGRTLTNYQFVTPSAGSTQIAMQ